MKSHYKKNWRQAIEKKWVFYKSKSKWQQKSLSITIEMSWLKFENGVVFFLPRKFDGFSEPIETP